MINSEQIVGLQNVQSLVMMPRLQQAIHMLQLNNIELSRLIDSFVEKNPFVKKIERPIPSIYSKEFKDYTSNLECKKSIYDSILSEIRVLASSKKELSCMEHIFSCTDIRTGIIKKGVYELGAELGVSADFIEESIRKLQSCSVVGFFARDIKESFKLRMKAIDRLYPKIEKVIDNIDIVLEKNIHALAKKCGMSVESAIEVLLEISKTRPFSSFSDSDLVQSRIPDVIIKRIDNNCWSIKLNEETLPRVLFDRKYEEMVLKSHLKAPERAFVKESTIEANWLIRSLEQRAKTILKVSKEILKKQLLFFIYGPEYLEPMNLKNVAQAIGVHESTVSRVTIDKYIMTDFGIVNMKDFFSNSINDITDSKISCHIIKRKILKLIENEDIGNLYSDDQISEKLFEEGIKIARRTVSKYRAALNIPGCKSRKKIKLLSN